MSPRMGARSGAQLTDARFSQSLETGLLIMGGFSGEEPLQGIADVADRMEASRSTVHRYMSTLVALGMLEQDYVTRRYRVGALAADLGEAALEADRTVRALDGELEALRRRTKCTVRMATLMRGEGLIVADARSFAKGQGLLGLEVRRGSRLPLHSTALGKALVGHLEQKELREMLGDATLGKLTSRTITGKRALLAELGEVHQRGFATEVDEHEDGVAGIAVPVLDSGGAASAALGLVGRGPEVTIADLEGHLEVLRAAARKIGARMESAQPTRAFRI